MLTQQERHLLAQYRALSPLGREAVQAVLEGPGRLPRGAGGGAGPGARVIPLYQTPAAAGYAAPVFGEDYDSIPVTDGVPAAAEFAVRIQGDSIWPPSSRTGMWST